MDPKPKASEIELASETPRNAEEIENEIRSLVISLKWVQRSSSRKTKTAYKAPIKPQYPQESKSTCYICEEALFIYDSVELTECQHRHCHSCLLQNFQTVLADAKYYPPRCCKGGLDLKQTVHVLSNSELDALLKIKEKYESTKLLKCAYCQNEMADASTSITDTAGYCSGCQRLTCATCGKEMHKGACPEEQGVKELVDTAKKRQWASCPKCNSIVEKNGGCNYVSCRCGIVFCYACGFKCTYPHGHGCQCNQRIKAAVTVGQSFDINGDTSQTEDQQVYQKILKVYQREAAVKQKILEKNQKALATVHKKHSNALDLALKVTDLRSKLDQVKEEQKKKEAAVQASISKNGKGRPKKNTDTVPSKLVLKKEVKPVEKASIIQGLKRKRATRSSTRTLMTELRSSKSVATRTRGQSKATGATLVKLANTRDRVEVVL
ncbi:hypothetical protein ABW20_dc0109238 [Dactylellina cionopaga]|nr:hypothetical protein ABW20_dc0109238 [Dactylellina cionopaga]